MPPSTQLWMIATPAGDARAHVTLPDGPLPRAALVLGHGAGGGVGAPDLLTARRTALAGGLAVALIEQPYRVAGRRSAPPVARLDSAWTAVMDDLRTRELAPVFVTGGRSSGARVACRTARVTGAAAVLCLAFPLQPPTRAGAERPAPNRQPELDGLDLPVLIVQGLTDRFGMPEPAGRREVARVAGDHGLKRDQPAIAAAIERWLGGLELPSQ